MTTQCDDILFFTDQNVTSKVGAGEEKTYWQIIEECQAVQAVFNKETNNVLIYIGDAQAFRDEVSEIKSLTGKKKIVKCGGYDYDGVQERCRVLILIKPPIKHECIKYLQDWAIDKKECSELCIDFLLQPPFNEEFVQGRIARHCIGWTKPQQQQIKPIKKFKVGELVDCTGNPDNKFFTLCFGKMGNIELQIREIGARYITIKNTLGNQFNPDTYIHHFMEVLTKKPEEKFQKNTQYGFLFTQQEKRIPRVLLMGESGVGKTMIARRLNELVDKSNQYQLARISIPEYLGKEGDLEASLFGYAPGNHTGGLENGSPGILEENVGGVVFLDEIGEASPTIQAKLLAYFDDYCVRPQSWVRHESFYCPTLIVAATNRDLPMMARDGLFRHDLLARFTDIIRIPPLRERIESIDFCVDFLLQQNEINPESKETIKEVAPDARMKLHYHDYRNGNFRELEEILTRACRMARQDGRRYLNAHDIVFW